MPPHLDEEDKVDEDDDEVGVQGEGGDVETWSSRWKESRNLASAAGAQGSPDSLTPPTL